MTHEELFMNTRFYAPSPLAMMIPELRKHAMSLANSSANSLTPIYYSVQPTLSGGEGGFVTFHVFAKGVSLTFCQDCRLLAADAPASVRCQNRAITN